MKKNKKNILIEIGTEELPYKNLYKILKNFKEIINTNIQKLNVNLILRKNFITPRRIAFILENNKEDNNLNEKIKTLIDKSLNDLPGTIKMRWKNYITSFIRPIKWYVLTINNKIINHTIFNIKSKNKTLSHKTLSKTIKVNANNYESKLEKYGYVICDYKKRKILIEKFIKNYAKKNKLTIILKKDSIINATNLVEHPSAIICNFKKIFLKLPEEIITTVLIKDNFCFLVKKKNKLINKIILIIDSLKETKEIKNGFEYIINTKLSELKYLYETEKNNIKNFKTKDLKKLIINDRLGNMYEKNIRIEKLIHFIKNKLKIKSNYIMLAAKLIKIDMLTKIVTELPELNGLICSYNLKNKEIKKHLYNYNRLMNNKIKKNRNSALIGLSDIIDNITSFFVIGKIPTSSKDPFNLKKDAKLIIKIITINKININIEELIDYSLNLHQNNDKNLKNNITKFITQKITNKKEYTKILSNTKNILETKNKIRIIHSMTKYSFNKKLLIFFKRIEKITEKNKTILSKKLNKKLLIKKEEKILFLKVKKIIKIINILNKNDLLFECAKTLITLEKEITNFFEKILIIDKEIIIRNNRLKLLNIIKNITFKKTKLDFLSN